MKIFVTRYIKRGEKFGILISCGSRIVILLGAERGAPNNMNNDVWSGTHVRATTGSRGRAPMDFSPIFAFVKGNGTALSSVFPGNVCQMTKFSWND